RGVSPRRWIRLYSVLASQWKRRVAACTLCSDTYSMIDSTVAGSNDRLDPDPGLSTPYLFKNRQQAAFSCPVRAISSSHSRTGWSFFCAMFTAPAGHKYFLGFLGGTSSVAIPHLSLPYTHNL